MDLDDMKSRWAETDRKLDRIMQLNLKAVREIGLSKMKSSLRWLRLGTTLELVILAISVVWLGHFIAGHMGEPKFLIPALLVDVCAIALVGACARQLVTISDLDYSGPVVAVQKELEKLRILRIRTAKWTFILACVLWAPMLIVLLRGTIGLDAYSLAATVRASDGNSFTWIIANVLFGVGLALLVIWASNRYAHRFADSPIVKSLMDDFAGRSLTKAMRSLESIVQFEVESNGEEEHSI